MLTKHHMYLRRQWMVGKINILATARKLGYRGASLTKGVKKVRTLLTEMGISVL